MLVDTSIHRCKDDVNISSDSDTYECGDENMGGVPNVILRGILPD